MKNYATLLLNCSFSHLKRRIFTYKIDLNIFL